MEGVKEYCYKKEVVDSLLVTREGKNLSCSGGVLKGIVISKAQMKRGRIVCECFCLKGVTTSM